MKACMPLWIAVLGMLAPGVVWCEQHAKGVAVASTVDSDGDGLSDALEMALLTQFAPSFQIAVKDCSGKPAEFWPNNIRPSVLAEDGVIYGQVFKETSAEGSLPVVEIHYYHLWKEDCGRREHSLDTEHVAVMVQGSESDLSQARWKAMYWYAAAHEDTVCDASQIARASTLRAEEHGPKVWVSRGKHASYLNETLCRRGCGADACDRTFGLGRVRIVNLGEVGHPMNGSAFIASPLWPLKGKMETSNFPEGVLAKLNEMPETEIAWFNAGRHPVQGVIAVSGVTEDALARSGANTEDALARSGANTTAAISVAQDSTGEALAAAGGATGAAMQKSYHATAHAVTESGKKVGSALGIKDKKID
jgi:hypothetical protein